MAQQAPLEPGSPLYDFALTIDSSTAIPEKLRCKNCQKFLLNGFKTACCEDGICEACNTAAIGKACPICKHATLVTNPSKALRGTAKNYLKTQMNNSGPNKPADTSPSIPPEPKDAPVASEQAVTTNGVEVKNGLDDKSAEAATSTSAIQSQSEQPDEVVQSIEQPRESSRRPTLDSASGNELDDDNDIEIDVGDEYDLSQIADVAKQTPAEEGDQFWDQPSYEKPRKNPPMPNQNQSRHQNPSQNQNQNQSFDQNGSFNSNDFNMSTPDFNNMPPLEAMNQMQAMMQNGMTMQNMGMMNPTTLAQMQLQMTQMMQSMQGNGPMGSFPHLQNMQQSMGMFPQMGMNGQNQNWPGMMGMMNPNLNPMMNNGASYNNSQQYQQNFNGDYRFNRNGSFDRGRGRGRNRRGRGAYNQFSQQDTYGNFNTNMPFQNQYSQGSMMYQQNQYDNNGQGGYHTNNEKEIEQPANDDDFAPGGQDEVQEALGESYEKKPESPSEEPKVEVTPAEQEVKHEEYQDEPSPAAIDQPAMVESPKQETKEENIPEAYREDLDFAAVPPTAPSGPSAKDVPYRARGHGRVQSKSRGSFHGPVSYPPRSPARPISQQQNRSPPANQGSGVIGAPTGPRAMREKDVLPPKAPPRAESDVGFKIRGTASQMKEQRTREEAPRSATPRSTYDDRDDRDRDSSRRHSRYDRKHESSKYYDQTEDHDDDRDRKRRKSRRGDDYDMEDADYSHSRSDSQERGTTQRNGRRDRDKPREKYSSSTSKHKSSRRHDEDDSDIEETSHPTRPSKKSSSKHDDREERRDRDYERAEKDKHRKRSRHDRDRDDEYEDIDEEESRRRSRKHKKEHRKERDRDAEATSTDLGMRITGRSSTHRNSEVSTPTTNQPEKDPHTIEREARNKERMLKEQQRRENAANAKGLSGGRTKSYKYEDDIPVKPSRRR